MQKDLRRNSVPDKGKGSSSGSHQANVSPGKREQQTEEGHGHGRNPKQKVGIAQRTPDHDAEPSPPPQIPNVPNLLHGASQKHIAHHRSKNDGENSAPRVKNSNVKK
jgi:hypothetical protein